MNQPRWGGIRPGLSTPFRMRTVGVIAFRAMPLLRSSDGMREGRATTRPALRACAFAALRLCVDFRLMRCLWRGSSRAVAWLAPLKRRRCRRTPQGRGRGVRRQRAAATALCLAAKPPCPSALGWSFSRPQAQKPKRCRDSLTTAVQIFGFMCGNRLHVTVGQGLRRLRLAWTRGVFGRPTPGRRACAARCPRGFPG
jgi:hypothetical protein